MEASGSATGSESWEAALGFKGMRALGVGLGFSVWGLGRGGGGVDRGARRGSWILQASG